MKEFLEKLLGIIVGILLIIFLIWLGMRIQSNHRNEYPWTGSIYTPNTVLSSKEFKTSEQCLNWVEKQRKDLDSAYDNWDYNCGYKCKYTDQEVRGGKKINIMDCEKFKW